MNAITVLVEIARGYEAGASGVVPKDAPGEESFAVVRRAGFAGLPGRGTLGATAEALEMSAKSGPPKLPFDPSRVVAADVGAMLGERVDVERLRRFLASAEVVDEGSSTVRAWAYAPWMNGSFVVGEDPSPVSIQIFYGGRARVTTADGRSVLFDGDAALLSE